MNEFMRPPFDLAAHWEKAERWTEAPRQGEEYRTKGRDNAVKSMPQQARTQFFSIYSAQTADFAFLGRYYTHYSCKLWAHTSISIKIKD